MATVNVEDPLDTAKSVKTAKTSTSNFGVGRREAHDASGFYARFERPVLSDDDKVPLPRTIAEPLVFGDSSAMSTLHDNEVALIVTSPPYFAGKQYEEELERDGIPTSYAEFLEMLTDVFAECWRVLEPGGRIAVNVANLGRKPYRSLAGDVTDILSRLGYLLRGEVVWRKGEGANGSCAWGSYRSPANPVLRDTTERVIIASKGRFDRAIPAAKRAPLGLPSKITITADEFMASTLDVWDLLPESAKRVHHPAPFPISLPERLIHLFTYENDLVVDPFVGSGTTMVAAQRTGRRYVGYDLDETYIEIAKARLIDDEAQPVAPLDLDVSKPINTVVEHELVAAGFTITGRDRKVGKSGPIIAIEAADSLGGLWLFDVSGALTSARTGLHRTETAWRAAGRAVFVANSGASAKLVLMTSHLPKRASEADAALRSLGCSMLFDAIELGSIEGRVRLAHYATGAAAPAEGFWSSADLPPDLPPDLPTVSES
jgi:DNA modification methylase